MSLLFIDSFDHYAAADVLKKWDSGAVSALGTDYGRRGTKGIKTVYHPAYAPRKNLAVPESSLICGFAFRLPEINQYFARFLDNGTIQVGFAVQSNGAIGAYRGASTLLGSSASSLVSANAFNYFEAKVVFHATAGSIVIRLNEAEVLNLTGINTRASANSYADQFELGGTGGVNECHFDDVYLCNLSGTLNNDFLGDCRVDAIFPTSDGFYTDFAPSTGGDHYALVDEVTPNTTDYNSSATVGDKDSYGYGNLEALTTQNIYGVQVCNCSVKSDAGAKSTANIVRSGVVDEESAVMVMTATSQLYYLSIHETDPDTEVAWTEAGINAMEAGVKVAA